MINRCRSGLTLILILSLLLVFSATGLAANLPIKAKSAILMEAQTGEVLYQHNPDEQLPMASVTKIMTMVLALEALRDNKVSFEDVVVGSYLAKSMGGTQIWLEEGEQMSFKDMLYAVAVGSANDCAVALAEYLGGSFDAFVAIMNKRASELGLTNTNYVNPSGLDAPNHYTSARDIAILSRYAVTLPLFLELTSTWEYWVRKGTPQEVWLTTFNKMIKQYPGYDGIKTGYTSQAGYCLSSTAQRNGVRLLAVVLGANTRQDRDQSIKALLDYGFQLYKAEQLLSKGEPLGQVEVLHGLSDSVDIIAGADLIYPVKKSATLDLSRELQCPSVIVAPITQGEQIGTIVFMDPQGNIVAKTPILAAETVERAGFFKIIGQTTRQMLKALFFGK